MLHGSRSSILADEDGQIADAHSISAGLDYPGVGPEHAWLRDSGRATYLPCTDEEALDAFERLTRTEGIIPALESAHALAVVDGLDAEYVAVCLSGRGDKDLAEALAGALEPRMSRKALVIYLVCEPETPALAAAAVEAGADVIELGFPFSDPLADGPVIQRASERALARGMRTAQCLDCLAATRALVGETPIVPMTYAALLEAYGWERFATDARARGATSLIVSDVPAGQRPELRRIQLVAPTSTDERIRLAASTTDGWLYLVTLTGTTGARDRALVGARGPRRARAPAGRRRAALRRVRDLDARAGAQPRPRSPTAIVVGSRAVQVAEEGPGGARRVRRASARRSTH